MPRSASLDIHLGRLIRARRRAARWSQKALGERLGVSFQQVQKYESGANRVSAATLYALAGLFRMTPSEFFDGWSLTPPDDRRRDPFWETSAPRLVRAAAAGRRLGGMKAHPTTTYRLVTPATWELVRAAYLSGLSAPTVCARFGISVAALRKRARREGWTKAAYAARDGIAPPYGASAASGAATAGSSSAGAGAGASPAGPLTEPPQVTEGMPPLEVNVAALARKALSDSAHALRAGRPRDARAFAQAAEAIARMDELIPYATPDDCVESREWRMTCLKSAVHEMAVQIAEGIVRGEPIPATYLEATAEWAAKRGAGVRPSTGSG